MSIPQICPSCGSHISAAHAKDCCYGTPEYAHLGWPNAKPISTMKSLPLTSILGTPAYQVADHLTSKEDGVVLHGIANPANRVTSDVWTHGAGLVWTDAQKVRENHVELHSCINEQLNQYNSSPRITTVTVPVISEPPSHAHATLVAEFNSKLHPDPDTASAIRRLLEYLNDEPEDSEPPTPASQEVSDKGKILCRLSAKANELRKEADGIYLVEARAKRNFAADILEGLIEELQ